MIGPTELMVVFLIVFVLFGASAVPKLARSLGQAKSEFKKGLEQPEKKRHKGHSEKANQQSHKASDGPHQQPKI